MNRYLSLLLWTLCCMPMVRAEDQPQPSAQEILQKAADLQGGQEIARKLSSFEAEFESEFRGKKGKIYYHVKRIFKFPSLLWTEKKHDSQKKPSFEIYDGEDGWLIAADKTLTVYTDKPSTFKTDMENLENDARLTKQMLRYFFVANLGSEINDLKRLSDKPVPRARDKAPVFLIEGKVTGWLGEEKTVYLKIYIDPATYQVAAVQMIDLSPGGRKRLFLFKMHMRNQQGVLVPALVEMYTDEETKPEMKISMDTRSGEDEESEKVYPLIEFNVDVDPRLFIIPEEEEE